ncbi:1-phosphatidylinositol-4,5-bisphosphate phosphodiesterase gamma 2 [Neurospora crassa OR74A]|uniref:Phosphoinositide phospholipase C n=1 Tax=Neurospora crassa (strain ATCC 24698 / 74-OR23-1A / CBS 708.71 / DSM 1257 / FGSC 987) TaxID=367110 RepID=A7UXE0_NEUCR|nr:1-phosphatidylinositol-4,5-bisphosphate phosphodiesterase gamma 2 [Neurospora crassa OR74A]EDO64907.2 1-phosphatidylinositol-4,5-bisphosphate phosphodiesterase gamma 2 [Neurospora crassa OR74A]|eukprot:XP_001727998.2 1-phosphatidylinositol-4,5-bisphosphate phosphodiesterase gamma 2 [Neurospora crassa OR74A]
MDQLKHTLAGLGEFAKENLPPQVTGTVTDLTSSVRSRLTLGSRRRTQPIDDEEAGDIIPLDAHAGGGHSTCKHGPQLRVSPALQSFIARNHILSSGETVADLLAKSHIAVPREVINRDYPLPEYFVSSSHNTYLCAHQLFGESSTDPYRHTLQAGSRCVEIDVWDNPDNLDEPKVTHGYTLVSNIPFREVCKIILQVVEEEEESGGGGGGGAPVLISLENHCGAQGQEALVRIMKEVWGRHLLDKPVETESHIEQDQHVRLRDLGSKIVVIVEHHLVNEASSDSSSDSSSEDEAEKKERKQRKQAKKDTPEAKLIIPSLAELGVYGQSVKPPDNSWFTSSDLLPSRDGPHHHLINVSESGLNALLSSGNGASIAKHNARHLMRVFPKGTRISSKNLKPLPFWGLGAQVCALNWQTFDASMQINEAMFAGTGGYVLKPSWLRSSAAMVGLAEKEFREQVARTRRRKRLSLVVAGASDVPVPSGRDTDKELKPYLTCTLLHPGVPFGEMQQTKKKTDVFRKHKLSALLIGGLTGAASKEEENSLVTDPVWDETLEWDEYEDDELVFLRMFIKSDDSFSSNPVLCVASVRLLYVEGVKGQWRFVRMLDLKGRETACTLLVKFEVDEL